MTSNPFDRAALTLGAVGVVSPVFALSTSPNNNFVLVRDASLVVLVILGACAVIGGATALRPLVLVAGAGYAVATVLQLVQFGRSTNWLNGNGSTFALLLGLAVGLLVVRLSSREHPASDHPG